MPEGQRSPVVSVIIPVYDGEAFLGEAITSVRTQTFAAWELLIVDDGSRDASAEIAARHAREDPQRIRVLAHEGRRNRGLAASRNLGVREARGTYVAPLDADDVWLPHKLERQVALLRAHPSAGMVFGAPLYWHAWTGHPEDRLRDHTPGLPTEPDTLVRTPDLLIRAYPLGQGSAPCPCDLLIRRDLVESVGGFEESFVGPLTMYEDQAFLAKVYLRADVFVSGERWSLYRQHDDSCVVAVTRGGDYDRVRLHFLEWLDRHLRALAAPPPPQVRRALRRALCWQRRPLFRGLRSRWLSLRNRLI